MSKKFPKWKKVLFLVITAVVLIRIVYIVGRGETEKQYQTSYEIDVTGAQEISCQNVVQKFQSDHDRLNSLELMFNGIAEDKLGYITLAVTSENGLLYQTNVSLVNVNNLEWKQIFVNMPLDSGKEYEIFITAQDCTQVPNLLLVPAESAAPEAIESYSGEVAFSGQISLKYGYLSEVSFPDKIMSSLVWIMFLLLFFLFLLYFEWIKEQYEKIWFKLCSMGNKEVIVIVLELIFSLIIIGSSGIEFQEPTKVLLYLISIVSAWKSEKKWKYIKDFLDKPWKKVCLYLLYFYGAFALVGQRILIYPLNQKVTVEGIFVLGIAVLWMVPVINAVCYWLEWISRRFVSKNSRRIKTPWFISILSVFLLLPASLNLYANNPGITSPDTMASMVTNAHHLTGMLDWHPAFYSMVLRVILKVWDSTYAVILVQYFFWIYVMTEGLLYLRKKHMKDVFLLMIALLSGINAGNFLHLNTIWKDIPYTLSVLWILILLLKLVLDSEEYRGKWYIYFEMIIALTGTYFYRKNGVVSFVVIAIVMLIMFYKNVKILVTFALTLMIIFAVKGPLFSYFQVVDPGHYGMYIGLGQDILGVYYAEGEVSEETLQMINVMTNFNSTEYEYMPTWSNQAYELNVEPTEFIRHYLVTFIKNPLTMVRAVIAREDFVWNIFKGAGVEVGEGPYGCINYTDTMDGQGEWNNYYPARKYNSFYPWMSRFTSYTANNQWISALEWRSGVFTLLGIITIFLMVCKKGAGKYLVILAPVAGQILSLLLSTGWSDFRYFWPLNLMNLFVLLVGIVLLKNTENEKGEL